MMIYSMICMEKCIRNIVYYRIGPVKYFLNLFLGQNETTHINTPCIGKGLFIQHGDATYITAKSIGDNLYCNQCVTIGYSGDSLPILGNNVQIKAGAKVIGDVKVGNNVIIGANAVVVKDVPDNCTVVGVPAYIIRKDGKRVNIKL